MASGEHPTGALTLRGQALLHGLADPAGSDPERFVRLAMAAPDVRYARVSSGNGRVLAQAGDARALLPTRPAMMRRRPDPAPSSAGQALSQGPRAELRLEIGMSARRDRAMRRPGWPAGLGLVLLDRPLLLGALLLARQRRARAAAARASRPDRPRPPNSRRCGRPSSASATSSSTFWMASSRWTRTSASAWSARRPGASCTASPRRSAAWLGSVRQSRPAS